MIKLSVTNLILESWICIFRSTFLGNTQVWCGNFGTTLLSLLIFIKSINLQTFFTFLLPIKIPDKTRLVSGGWQEILIVRTPIQRIHSIIMTLQSCQCQIVLINWRLHYRNHVISTSNGQLRTLITILNPCQSMLAYWLLIENLNFIRYGSWNGLYEKVATNSPLHLIFVSLLCLLFFFCCVFQGSRSITVAAWLDLLMKSHRFVRLL